MSGLLDGKDDSLKGETLFSLMILDHAKKYRKIRFKCLHVNGDIVWRPVANVLRLDEKAVLYYLFMLPNTSFSSLLCESKEIENFLIAL